MASRTASFKKWGGKYNKGTVDNIYMDGGSGSI